MRVVIQRVKEATVSIGGEVTASIGKGLVVLLGVEEDDRREDVLYLASKICQLRIFPDNENKMNLDIKQTGGDILLVSQFTLHASTKKGNRPSFTRAAHPHQAIPLYLWFESEISLLLDKPVKTGEFGANMQVALVNDGPVTIVMDSKNKE